MFTVKSHYLYNMKKIIISEATLHQYHDEIAKIAEEKLGTDLIRFGEGGISTLYRTEDGHMVKKNHWEEADKYEQLKGKESQFICKTSQVIYIKAVGVVVKEFIPDIDDKTKKDLDTYFTLLEKGSDLSIHQLILKKGKTSKFYDMLKANYPNLLYPYGELYNMAVAGKNLRLGLLDINEENIGKKHGHLVLFDPFAV